MDCGDLAAARNLLVTAVDRQRMLLADERPLGEGHLPCRGVESPERSFLRRTGSRCVLEDGRRFVSTCPRVRVTGQFEGPPNGGAVRDFDTGTVDGLRQCTGAFECMPPDPLQCQGCRVNQVAWHEAGIRSQRAAAGTPTADNEKRTTRPPRWHVREQRRGGSGALGRSNRDLQLVWGGRAEGLTRLRDSSRQLQKLHRAERALLHERDELVHALRRGDVSWALLSTWSGRSRQALSKRPNSPRPSSGLGPATATEIARV